MRPCQRKLNDRREGHYRQCVDLSCRFCENLQEHFRLNGAGWNVKEEWHLGRNYRWHRANDLTSVVKTQEGRFFAKVDRCRNEFPTVNAISGWTHNLGHVRPETIPAFSPKEASIARAAHWHPSAACLIQNGLDILWFNKGIAQSLSFWIGVNL